MLSHTIAGAARHTGWLQKVTGIYLVNLSIAPGESRVFFLFNLHFRRKARASCVGVWVDCRLLQDTLHEELHQRDDKVYRLYFTMSDQLGLVNEKNIAT